MRLPIVLVLLSLPVALQAQAPRRISVEELEQILAKAAQAKDSDLAQKLADVELNRPIAFEQFEELETECRDRRCRNALMAMADRSAFVERPGSVDGPPAMEQEKQIIAKMAAFATRLAHQMPNFIATRTTTRFEEEDQEALPRKIAGIQGPVPLLIKDQRGATLTYRNGQEQVSKERLFQVRSPEEGATWRGLFDSGLFGPLLTAVLVDASQSSLKWDRWEQNGAEKLAVFQFRVPFEKSSYRVVYCCTDYVIDRVSAYHGVIAVRPDDGSIARLTLLADLEANDAATRAHPIPLTRADMTIEYAAVQMGGRFYFCPVHAVALSSIKVPPADWKHYWPGREKTHLNDVTFTEYHVFGSESHILPGAGEAADK